MGGDRQLLSAAARPARRGRAADAVAHARPLRPARGAGHRRAVRHVRRRCPPRAPTRRTRPGCAPAATRRSRWSSSARGGDYDARSRACAPRRRSAGCACASRRWTSSATHAILPLLATDAGVRLQVRSGVDAARRRFGTGWRGGFWLPECAYAPWLLRALEDAGVRAVCVELTALRRSGAASTCARCSRDSGVVLVPIDRAHDRAGVERRRLPGSGAYRDYHHHTVHHHNPWNNAGGAYDHEAALALARAHAADFVASHAARGSPKRARARLRRAAGRGTGGVRTRHRAARPLVVRGHRLAASRRAGVRAPGAGAGAARRCARTRGPAAAGVARRRWPGRAAQSEPPAREWRAEQLGRGRGPVDLVGAGGGRDGVRARGRRSWRSWRRAPTRARGGARAARAAGERLAVHGLARDRRALRRSSASRGTGARARGRCAPGAQLAAQRNLAIDAADRSCSRRSSASWRGTVGRGPAARRGMPDACSSRGRLSTTRARLVMARQRDARPASQASAAGGAVVSGMGAARRVDSRAPTDSRCRTPTDVADLLQRGGHACPPGARTAATTSS